MEKVTDRNFFSRQKSFRKDNPYLWRMIRPDRQFDLEAHRYADDQGRRIGDAALRAWFEYLAAKGFIRTFKTWREILKSGKSIMVVCDNPLIFDPEFVPPVKPVLPESFWCDWGRKEEFSPQLEPISVRWKKID